MGFAKGPTGQAYECPVVEINMPAAGDIAGRYRNRGVPLEDLQQVAYLALVKAVGRFEHAADREFLSYAVPTMRGEVKRYFRDLGWTIRPTRSVQVAQARIVQAEGELLQQLGRSPRPSELAEHLDMDLELVIEALSANGCYSPTSLEALAIGDEGEPHDWWGDDDPGYDGAESMAVLKPLMAALTQRELVKVEMRFFQDKTQAEIGPFWASRRCRSRDCCPR